MGGGSELAKEITRWPLYYFGREKGGSERERRSERERKGRERKRKKKEAIIMRLELRDESG